MRIKLILIKQYFEALSNEGLKYWLSLILNRLESTNNQSYKVF